MFVAVGDAVGTEEKAACVDAVYNVFNVGELGVMYAYCFHSFML